MVEFFDYEVPRTKKKKRAMTAKLTPLQPAEERLYNFKRSRNPLVERLIPKTGRMGI